MCLVRSVLSSSEYDRVQFEPQSDAIEVLSKTIVLYKRMYDSVIAIDGFGRV